MLSEPFCNALVVVVSFFFYIGHFILDTSQKHTLRRVEKPKVDNAISLLFSAHVLRFITL